MSQAKSSEKLALFQEFKFIIEKILSHHSHDVWSVHGGLQSLVHSIDAIFQHGTKPQSGLIGIVIDYWLFVRGLKWLDPTLASNIDNLSKLPAASPAKPQRSSSFQSCSRNQPQLTHGQQWIEKSLMDRNISKQIRTLLSDFNYVKEHYFDWAILLDQLYTSAILVCLSALEQNAPALLANIPVSLFVRRSPSRSNLRMHHGSTDRVNQLVTSDIIPNCDSQGPNSLNSPARNILSVTDPLNVSAEPAVILATKQVKQSGFRQKSSSLNFSIYPDCFDLSTQSTASMGLDTVDSDLKPTVDSNTADASLSLQERLLPRRRLKLASEGDSSEVSTARKPLFYDSDDADDSLPDGLHFLLSSNPDLPVSNTQLHLYYSTIDVKPSLEQTVLSSAKTSTEAELLAKSSKTITEQLQPSNNLPDLVISAEESRSSKIPAEEPKQVPCISNNEPTAVEKSIERTKKTSPFHRRSRSDHTHEIKLRKDIQVDPHLTEINDNFENAAVKSAPSFSPVQSPSFYQRSHASTLTRSTSLMNYLKNQDLTTCADIEKENAHFDFSEILIGAIEQMKCQMQEHKLSFHISDEGTPQQAITMNENHFQASAEYSSPLGSFVTTAPVSHSTLVSRSGLPIESDHSNVTEELENLRRKSAVSDVTSKTDSLRTAESIAIGLLQAFSDQRHVTSNDFDWLISEEDVPQKLLPLPKSTVVDPDFSNDQGIRLRGNQEWAPPRPQIIFNTPTKLKLKSAMSKQNNRCAGCGTYVEKEFMKRFRYCEYTGKFFCTCCHDNKLAVLPAFVLQKFDFTKYKVSNFSYDLLTKISNEPLFNIEDINPSLYRKSKQLAAVRDLRIQMHSLYKYIQQCRFADSTSEDCEDGLKGAISSALPSHFLSDDLHPYSLVDLERTKSGELMEDLKSSVEMASNHVTTCELCRSKGFICEICHSSEIIFPHQSVTSRCAFCKSCFHKKCFVATSCPKCARLLKRRQVLEQISEE